MTPTKSGIDYFPLDTSIDEKIELIEAEFGIKGFGVVVRLFQWIYGREGYYLEWTKEVALLFSHKIGEGESVVSEIVAASIRRGIFDQRIFDTYGLLTSRGIQKRYFEIVKRRKDFEILVDILLVDASSLPGNVCIKRENVNIFSKNADISAQSKVKERKVKESKENMVAPQDAARGNGQPFENPFQDELGAAFAEWLAYKAEKRQPYKEMGFKSLVTQIKRYAAQFGEAATVSAIRDSMANNYQGIVFDRIGKGPGAAQSGKKKTTTFYDVAEQMKEGKHGDV